MRNIKRFLITVVLGLLLNTSLVSAKTAATVNGIKITVKETNKALKVLTKGKMTWRKLPKKGKEDLIQMMAPSKIVAATARKKLTSKEKEAAVSGYWMQKKLSKIKISDKEAKTAYNKMKEAAKKIKSKTKIPPFAKIKNNLKMQLAQEKVVSRLMEKAKIKLR